MADRGTLEGNASISDETKQTLVERLEERVAAQDPDIDDYNTFASASAISFSRTDDGRAEATRSVGGREGTVTVTSDDQPSVPADALEDVELKTTGDTSGVVEAIRSAGDFDDDRFFTTNAPGNQAAEYNVSVYESEAKESRVGGILFEQAEDASTLADVLVGLPADAAAGVVEGADPSEAIVEAGQEADARRETRAAARDAAEAAGVDLDEFGIDATAEGEVIVQDRDTGRTRNIDADAPGGVGSAIDAATGKGQFVADDADPAASGSGSGDGLGARAAGAIVLLFGALAAALGWLS